MESRDRAAKLPDLLADEDLSFYQPVLQEWLTTFEKELKKHPIQYSVFIDL